MTHTPGPWRVETYPTDVRPHIVHGHEGNGRTIATVTAREGNEQQNAALIAAAPGLLAALEAILAWATRECMPQGGKNDGPWEMAEAAIARARP